MAETPKRLRISPDDSEGAIKREISNRGDVWGGAEKLPIANTSGEWGEMDSVDYVDFAKFLHIHATFRATRLLF